MKALSTLAIAAIFALPALASADDQVVRLSEPVEVTDDYEVFGSKFEPGGEPAALAEIIANDDAYADKQVVVKTRVAKVCQKKGCFFIAQDGEAMARVSFKDYGFFVPTDTGGKTVTLVGTFSKKVISEAAPSTMAASTTCPWPEPRASRMAHTIPKARYIPPPPKSPTRLSGGTGASPARPIGSRAPASAM